MPGTLRVISARMNYLPEGARAVEEVLGEPDRAYIARYALGRDYHKVLRRRLQQLADRIAAAVGEFQYRVFTDSAPVMEVELAVKAGLGWRGKHTLLLNREAGSYFFLGEIYTDLPLPVDDAQDDHCGTCEKCITVCPTQAIVAPYQLDARRCISYLTIEHKGSIPHRIAPADRQPRLRLRRLPAGVSVEPLRADERRTGFCGAQRAGQRDAGGAVCAGARAISTTGSPAARYIASATSAGCAIWRSAWAMRCAALGDVRLRPRLLLKRYVRV